jgi:hypothetical protein
LKIEQYFLLIQEAIETCPIVRLSNVSYEKRGTYEGVVRGRLHFADETILEWREYVDVEVKHERLMYVYQYMGPSQELVFLYDNTGHHKRLGLPTYPHHKHEGRDANVVPCDQRD